MSETRNDTLQDSYGFKDIAIILKDRAITSGDNQYDYVYSKREYLRAIIQLSDKVESLPIDVKEVDAISAISTDVCRVTYCMQNMISKLAAEAPVGEDTTYDPYINAGEQLYVGVPEWDADITINFVAAMNAMRVDDTQFTKHGLESFTNSLMNIDTPDVVIATYFNLVKYLTKFKLMFLHTITSETVLLANQKVI